MAFRRVFVPGVNEGLFPRPPAEDPLLLEAQRRDLGIELRADDTELLRIAAACASERLTLSFSRLDLLTGRERVPSFYAFAAHRAAGGREIGVREFESRARSATRTRIGWPAPPDAADAIDDAEFDLATLAPLAKGSGQYLKSLPGRSVHVAARALDPLAQALEGRGRSVIEEIGSDALRPTGSPSAPGRPPRCSSTRAVPTASRCAAFSGCAPPNGRPASSAWTRPRAAISTTRCNSSCFATWRRARPLPVQPGNLRRGARPARRRPASRWRGASRPISRPPFRRSGARKCRPFAPTCAAGCNRRPPWSRIGRPSSTSSASASTTRRAAIRAAARTRWRSTAASACRGRSTWWSGTASGMLRVVDHKTGRIPEPRPEMTGGGEVLQPALYALAAERCSASRVALTGGCTTPPSRRTTRPSM